MGNHKPRLEGRGKLESKTNNANNENFYPRSRRGHHCVSFLTKRANQRKALGRTWLYPREGYGEPLSAAFAS